MATANGASACPMAGQGLFTASAVAMPLSPTKRDNPEDQSQMPSSDTSATDSAALFEDLAPAHTPTTGIRQTLGYDRLREAGAPEGEHRFESARLSEGMARVHELFHRILETYELLEMILLHLPTRSLIVVQRVATSFKAVTDRSSRLRRALLFEPRSPIVSRNDSSDEICLLNAMLQGQRTPHLGPWRLRSCPTLVVGGGSPCLFLDFRMTQDLDEQAQVPSPHQLPLASGSWRRLIVSQPRYTVSVALKAKGDDSPDRLLGFEFIYDDTITFGAVEEALYDIYRRKVALAGMT